jgi:CRP-like cAMP-binding protein
MSKKVARRKPAVRPPPADGTGNLLLGTLPASEYSRLAPLMKRVPLTHRLFLLKRDQPIEYVFFPEEGVCSLTTGMKDGSSVEVATVGREGVIGFDLLLGLPESTVDAFVQVAPGAAQRLPAAAFRRELDSKGPLFQAVTRYSRALLSQIVQTAACNRLHKVQGRCARWLLLTHDRVDSDEFSLSHEFLSFMLGVERSTVTVIAGALQKAGLIRYVHGRITIVDRAGLEGEACECYQVTAERFADIGLRPNRS